VKNLFSITLGLVLLTLIFTSCSLITGASTESNEELYKAAIERYFNSIIQADTDSLLDSTDPLSYLYPSADVIEELRAEWKEYAAPGEAIVKELTTLEESATRATVKANLFIRADFDKNGEFDEITSNQTIELTYKNGVWRIFDRTVE